MKYKNNLFQYDQNQTITNVDGLFVDYILNDETLRVPVVDGNAIIPNEVLAVAGMHYAYVCLANETRLEFRFKVTARVAPPDVPYAPSHAITFDDLVKTVQDEVKSLEERAASGEFDGKDGQDYVITPADYDAIAERVTLEGVVKTVNHVAPDAEGNVDVQGGGETTDVQLNGVSITKDGVANIPVAGETLGVVKVQSNGVYGIESVAGGHVAIKSPTTKDITDRAPYKAVTLDVLDDAVSTSLNKPKKTSPIDTWASARKNMKAQTEFTAGTNLEWVEEQTTLGKKYTLNAAGYDDTEIKGQIEALDGSVVKTVNGVAPVDGNVDVQGGGSSVTMADNAQGGVDLTVDGSTKTLAKEGELATIKADLTELDSSVVKTVNGVVPTNGNVVVPTGTPQEYNQLVEDVAIINEQLNIQGKSENLFDVNNPNLVSLIPRSWGDPVVVNYSGSQSVWIKVKPNSTLTMDNKTSGNRFQILTLETQPVNGTPFVKNIADHLKDKLTVTVGETDVYVLFYLSSDGSCDLTNLRIYYGTEWGGEITSEITTIENKFWYQLSEDKMFNLVAYKPLGYLSKPYIAFSCDDGAEPLATVTIPKFKAYKTQYNRNIPLTMGLMTESVCLSNDNYLSLVNEMISSYGCEIATHGSYSYPTFSNKDFITFMDTQEAYIESKTGVKPIAVIYPNHAYDLEKSVLAGSYYGVCAGGYSKGIVYNQCCGNRSNMYELHRWSLFTGAQTEDSVKAVIDYAYEHNLLLLPWFHDSDLVGDNAERNIRLLDICVSYGISKGMNFISFKDIKTII